MRLTPLINLRWVTEIQSVKPMESFIDNQIHGPYRLWHHLHRFEANEQGVLMTDLVHYALPFGPLGAITHALYVRKKPERIFQFRKETLAAHSTHRVPTCHRRAPGVPAPCPDGVHPATGCDPRPDARCKSAARETSAPAVQQGS